MQLSKGDRVKLIDDDLEGVVIEIKGEHVLIATEDDFDYWKPIHDLIKLNEDSSFSFKTKLSDYNNIAESPNKQARNFTISLEGKQPIIDLHIDVIATDGSYSSNHEALLLQLEYFRKTIEKAKSLRKRNLIVIHGYGKGRLREELQKLLKSSYPEIEFIDASYQKFGHGALELIIHGLGRL